MNSRSSSLRIKVVALLVSLFSLWAFAATVTAREGLNLLWLGVLKDDLGIPADELVTALQHERRLSLVYVGGGTSTQRAELIAQRRRTDHAVAKFERLAQSDLVSRAATDSLEQRITEMADSAETLGDVRATIDERRVNRSDAVELFSPQIDAGFRIYGSISTLDDEAVAKYARTMVRASRARELLSQEDAMLAGAIAARAGFTETEHAEFVQLVGAQRFTYDEALADLSTADQRRYAKWSNSKAFKQFRTVENQAVTSRPRTRLSADHTAWQKTAEQMFTERRALETASADALVEQATPAVIWVLVRLLLAGGLGLIAVIASIVVSITTARSLVRQLEKLRNAARDLANERLPRVVERLRRGEEVDIEAEAPPLEFGTDEIGQVGRAFNEVQATAVRAAVEQAELRQGVRDVFLSLARRSQALVHRQLSLLDSMERKETVPEELEQLFRVDHLATRMRRNAENLIVLSGAVPGRGWRNPIPIVDVVRGAVAEVEEYERVTVAPVGSSALAGRSVGDVIHLLAELIENALSFSPPHTMVNVSGQLVGTGFAVEIEDRGLGMSAEDIEAANEQLENPPEFNLSSTARLGLYVVGRLAERHKVRVRLRSSPYGGVTAVVLIPTSLIIGDADTPTRPRGSGEVEETVAIDRAQIAAPKRTPTTRDRSAQRALTSIPAVEQAPAKTPPPYGSGRSDKPKVKTPSGLPRRVRQASLAAPLRQEPEVEAPSAEADARPPEEVRRMMSSYQRGTEQARTEAGTPAPDEDQ